MGNNSVIKSDGQRVEVSFEDWVEALIDKSITRHKDSCPAKELEGRLKLVEVHLRIIIAALVPVYLWGISHILSQIAKVI